MFYDSELDTGVKNQPIAQDDIMLAKLQAGEKCPCCKIRFLTDENVQIDHLKAKSKSSDTEYVAICDYCNQQKSNLTMENLIDQQEYVVGAS